MRDIRLKTLTMSNWKCFKFKTVKFVDGLNLYEQENGFGKSSIFEAIIYCLYGVLPSSDSTSLKNDKNKPITLTLELIDHDTKETFKIKKEIVSATVKNFYFMNIGEESFSKVNVNQINQFCSKFCGNKDLFPLIWSNKPICQSPIFDISYIKNNVLEYEFADSNELSTIAKKVKFNVTRNIKELERNVAGAEGLDIDKEIGNLKGRKDALISELKDSTKTENLNVSKALMCLEAQKELSEIRGQIEDRIYDVDEIYEFKRLTSSKPTFEKIINDYSENTGKIIDKFKIFNSRFVKGIIQQNAESGLCPVCNQSYDFSEELETANYEEIISFLNKNVYSEEQFENAKEELIKLEEFNAHDVEISQKILELSVRAVEVDNPEEIIEADKKSKNDSWDELDKIEERINELNLLKINYAHYLELKDELVTLDSIIKTINKYVVEKTNSLISSIIFETIKILSEVDKKYISLYYNLDENCYDICMIKDDDVKVLSHNLLSSGERSLLAIALTMSFRKVLREKKNIPSFILLDESLSSLDKGHLQKCLEVIKNSGCQSLIVNHN